jgi:hypothetical protein
MSVGKPMANSRLLTGKNALARGFAAYFIAETLQAPYQFVVFSYIKTNTKSRFCSQNMNARSLSTFDSSVSCLYFFESEYTHTTYA